MEDGRRNETEKGQQPTGRFASFFKVAELGSGALF